MKSTTLAAAAIGVGVGTSTLCYLIYRRFQKKRLQLIPAPDKWQRLGTLKEISIYPMKSTAELQLEEANCNDNGLSWRGLHDRHLLLINDEGQTAYAGWYPHMLSIRTELVRYGVLRLRAPHMEPITLDLNELAKVGTPVNGGHIRKLNSLCLAECKPEHHAWCSQVILNRPNGLRLYITLDKELAPSFWRSQNRRIPIMVLHDKSVHDLNTRISAENQAHRQQFRGNLLIASLPEVLPYDEDHWQWLKIGDDVGRTILLHFNSECLRCILVNVDVDTCTRNAAFEPLRTLKKYRLHQNPREPAMGTYFDVLGGGGLLKKGDAVYVQYRSK